MEHFKYVIKDRNDAVIASDVTEGFFTENDFRSFLRARMMILPMAHYAEYYQLNVRMAKKRTIANF